ncbi:MAG: hypothetical protein Q9227_004048 [Pyrenula ochraceoflavens]
MPEASSGGRFLFPTPEAEASDDNLQRVSSPEEFPPFRRSVSNDRWTPQKSNHERWGVGTYRQPYRHGSKRSVSEALGNFRTRRGSVSTNAQELADALKAPVSYKLVALCISILIAFPQPVTLTIVQFAFVSLWCLVFAFISSLFPRIKTAVPALRNGIRYPSLDVIRTTMPLAVFQLLGHILSSTATAKIPVSLVHTIKGLSPLFTVLAYRVFFRIRYARATYLSLIPLTAGVMLACSTDFSTNFIGISCALLAALVFVSQNIFSKKLFNEAARVEAEGSSYNSRKLDKLNLLCYCSAGAFILTTPVWLLTEGVAILGDVWSDGVIALTGKKGSLDHGALSLEFMFNGIFHFGQNIMAFILLSMLSPVSYSVASLIKRVWVIVLAILWFRSSTSPVQLFGIGLTFFGLYLYDRTSADDAADQRAKSDRFKPMESEAILPLTEASSSYRANGHTIHPGRFEEDKSPALLGQDLKKDDDGPEGRSRGNSNSDAWLPPGTRQESTWEPGDDMTMEHREIPQYHRVAAVGKEHEDHLKNFKRSITCSSSCLSGSMRSQLMRAAARSRRLGGIQPCRSFASTSRRRAEVELTVDGKKVSIEAGSALIQACEKAGVVIPRYCYHEKLLIAGNCRMCLVEVERAPKPVASCAWPVQPGMVVKTNSPLTNKAREGVMEFLLSNHPLDCPICDQGGECDLQDQSMRYGADRGRFHEISGKRAVEDKNIGPLIKTSMNRCIHCTRCVRFANDVAGAPELGSTGRGNDMQIGTYLEQNLDSEMSGNVIDLCPVGALTSKPYAFRARPWELQHTETIDVLDALGSNIRVDSRGMEVMRVLPRLNDDINEEWINDKTRFAPDGLRTQRLTTPLLRKDDKFYPSTWEQALTEIGTTYQKLAPKPNEFKVIAGQLTEVESLVAMKDLANRLGSDNLALDQSGGSAPISHGLDVRSNYLFNSKIYGVEEADVILLVGTNPRHEAAGLNARIRKQWLRSDLEIGLVGETFDSTFGFEHLGTDAAAVKKVLAGEFGKKLVNAQRPMIIVGSGVIEHPDSKAILEMVGSFVDKNSKNFVTPEWQGYNVLQRAASRAGAYEVGFTTPSSQVAQTKPKMVWLLGADEIAEGDIPKDAFVVYQGHHGDKGAQIADVVLPGAAYTEKSATYLNTEGRCQVTRNATSIPGAAREDWKIIRAVSEYLGQPLPYDDIEALRDRMEEISPVLRRYDLIEPTSLATLSRVQLVDQNKGAKPTGKLLKKPIENFFFTDVISRCSPTMARCSASKATGNPETNFMAQGEPHAQNFYGPEAAAAAG